MIKSPVLSLLMALIALAAGCAEAAPSVDPEPFRKAVTQYLEQNNMALRLKEIRVGPTVSGDQATMKVSLTHAQLGGPSVVWTFEFQRSGDGSWQVVSHTDKP